MSDILADAGFSRSDRRKLIREQAKRLGAFEFEERPDLTSMHEWCSRLAASGRYWLQEKKEDNGWLRAMIGRHDKAAGISWPELQKIKCALYGNRWAMQCYPPEDKVVDVANVYWLFVAPEYWIPEWGENE